MDEVLDEILFLKTEINKHNYDYYVMDNPKIEDAKYDALVRRLEFLEQQNSLFLKKDSPTQKVGGEPLAEFKKAVHKVQMESLGNVFSKQELIDFDFRIKKNLSMSRNDVLKYVLETKIDGLSVSLIYEHGKLIRGSTRGDGKTGEDVTQNLKEIKTLPKNIETLANYLEVRGEVYMSKENFLKLNEEREAAEETKFSNPRNAAAGSLRQLDNLITRSRNLDILIFNLQEISEQKFESHVSSLEFLKKIGFNTSPIISTSCDIEQIFSEIEKLFFNKETYPYQIDGAVVKIDDLEIRKILGSTSKNPRWAIAYKYPQEQKETKLQDIIVQIGRTGTVTPVAVLEAVFLGGASVNKATLHNIDNIKNKDVRIGDYVVVQKAGDIIPEVVKSVKEKRSGFEKIFSMPKNCPVCGHKLLKEQSVASIKCTNAYCSAQTLRKILHFASLNAMNIEGLGFSTIKQLLDKNIIEDFSDIFYLDYKNLAKLERFGEKSAKNLLESIEKSKHKNLDKLLYGLGVPLIGLNVSKKLAKKYLNLENIINESYENFLLIDEIGDKMAKSICEYFKTPKTLILIEKLKIKEVNMTYVSPEKNDHMKNKKFLLTGTLSKLTRIEATNAIEQLGASVSKSLSKNIDFVVYGKNPGSKFEKARKFEIKTLSEEEFLSLLNI